MAKFTRGQKFLLCVALEAYDLGAWLLHIVAVGLVIILGFSLLGTIIAAGMGGR